MRSTLVLLIPLALIPTANSFRLSQQHVQRQSFTRLSMVDVDSLTSLSPDVVVPAVGGVIVAAAAAAARLAGGSKASNSSGAKVVEPEPEPIDVSIPYDAAAQLAYDSWRVDNNKGDSNASGYAAFQKMYEQKSVAEVTAKKMKRELDTMDSNLNKIDAEMMALEN